MDKKLLFYLIFLFYLLFSSDVLAAPPIPARIGGTLTLDGVQLTRNTNQAYIIKVTRLNGTAYEPTAGDNDGLNASDWYIVDIPIYDANNCLEGASIGETAIVHVYRGNKELTVKSPANGHIIVGKNGSTTRIDLIVETSEKISKAIP